LLEAELKTINATIENMVGMLNQLIRDE